MTRAMTAEDLEPCTEVFVETFTAPPWAETWSVGDARRRLDDFWATPHSHGVVEPSPDGAVHGFALGHRERFGAVDHFLLQEMCVRGPEQRRGLGGALLAAPAAELPDVEHWFLLTARDSAAAAFYARYGFRPAAAMGVFVRP